MNKIFVLICYHLGLWGFVGFIATLIIGFIACCTNLSPVAFYAILGIVAAFGISATTYCITKKCKKDNLISNETGKN